MGTDRAEVNRMLSVKKFFQEVSQAPSTDARSMIGGDVSLKEVEPGVLEVSNKERRQSMINQRKS